MTIEFGFVGIRDVSSWSDKMREPFIKLYGEEYFRKHWGNWIDAIIRYYKERKGIWLNLRTTNISTTSLQVNLFKLFLI